MNRVFVINPRAGSGQRGAWLEKLESYFRRHGQPFEARLCQNRQDTIQKTRQALLEGADQIVAVGGDGTMNAVLQGFLEDDRPLRPEAALAVARVGTGSDYYRTLVEGVRADWRQMVLDPRRLPVDVGRIETHRPDAGRPWYFLNLAGWGLSAEVVERKERLPRWLPRSLCYLAPTLASYLNAQPVRFSLEADGRPFERNLLSLIVGKGIYAGGGMRFGGGVKLDDGWLEMTTFAPLSLPRLLLKTPKLYRGNYQGEPTIEKLRLQHLRLRGEPIAPAECDGERIGRCNAEVTLLPRALTVCVPHARPD